MCVYRAYYFSTESYLVRTSFFLSQASLHPFSLTRLTHAHMTHFIRDIHTILISYAHAHASLQHTHKYTNSHTNPHTNSHTPNHTHHHTHKLTKTNPHTTYVHTYTFIHIYLYTPKIQKYHLPFKKIDPA